jgi:hypothetical protein
VEELPWNVRLRRQGGSLPGRRGVFQAGRDVACVGNPGNLPDRRGHLYWKLMGDWERQGADFAAASDLDAGLVRFRDDPTYDTVFEGFDVDGNTKVTTGIDINHRTGP